MNESETAPLVSIVIPNYNMECFLAEAIQSALDQTWPNTEILVADNASSDASWQVISKFDGKVVKIRREQNLGLVGNSNDLFARARGNYICLLCSDDVLEPDFIATAMVLYRKRPDLGYVQLHYQPIDERGHTIEPVPPPFYAEAGIVPGGEETRISLLGCHTILSHHLYSAEAVRKVGGLTTYAEMACDYEMALHISMSFDVGYIPKALVRYRYSEKHLTAYNRKSMLTVLDQYRVRLRILDRLLPKNHPFQPLRPKIIAAAAKEALTYGRASMDAGDYSTARRYVALMVAFDYQALESAAVEREYHALKAMLEKTDPEITIAWAKWKADEVGHTAQLHREKGGPPFALPKGSLPVSAAEFAGL